LWFLFDNLAAMTSRRRGRPPHPDLLTPAEWSVLRYVRGRLSYGQIALGRRISRDAVKQHAANIRRKLGLVNRAELEHWRGQPSEHQRSSQDALGSDTMPINRVDILINVSDVERSLSFYRDLIGMKVDATWADEDGRARWAKLIASGGSSLMLNQPSGHPLADRASRPAYRDAVVYLKMDSTDELHAVHCRLGQSGAEPGECHDEMYGLREFTVRDPDGYEVALVTPLGS
jgi:DNA-binding CsgD family transcriptional regulator/catechol 2,3-dioxygenase-like lactoylglutathione lyase family enzyme